jgi:release factor glutamine methyltransferase
LISHVTHKDKTWLTAHPEFELNNEQVDSLKEKIDLLLEGVPLPYLIYRQSFYNLDFHVTQDVLIPRPETELMVEEAIKWLYENEGRKIAADVGTGSGCIAISIANEIQDINFIATDISFAALQIARENAISHQVYDRIQFMQTDLLDGIQTQFDLICANLPYIPTTKLMDLPVSRYEPIIALDGGEDGFTYNDQLLRVAPRQLAPRGLLLMEFESPQAENIERKAKGVFPSAEIEILNDLAGLPRLLKIHI